MASRAPMKKDLDLEAQKQRAFYLATRMQQQAQHLIALARQLKEELARERPR